MTPPPIFDTLIAELKKLLSSNPTADIEKNLKATLQAGFARMDLVTREEFEVQKAVLAKTRAQLDALTAKLDSLEAKH
ncbi:MAG: hypothetical protein RLZZ502_1767 [Pseudomonadota bacterium]|jgi:BMFP domain-containing protein YqiC